MGKPLIPSPPLMFAHSPPPEFSEELREASGLVVCVEAAGVRKNPSMAAAEGCVLQADPGVLVAGDDAVGTDADEGDDGGPPAFHFGLEASAAGAQFVVGQFVGAGGGAVDDVGDPELEVEQEITFKGGEESRRESAAVEGGPEAVAGAAEVPADGGRVEPGVDPGEEHDEVLGNKIRHPFIARSEELGRGRFPGGGQFPFQKGASNLAKATQLAKRSVSEPGNHAMPHRHPRHRSPARRPAAGNQCDLPAGDAGTLSPNMSLAKDLLKKGERQAVLDHFDRRR
jgi:hypothetical protein